MIQSEKRIQNDTLTLLTNTLNLHLKRGSRNCFHLPNETGQGPSGNFQWVHLVFLQVNGRETETTSKTKRRTHIYSALFAPDHLKNRIYGSHLKLIYNRSTSQRPCFVLPSEVRTFVQYTLKRSIRTKCLYAPNFNLS